MTTMSPRSALRDRNLLERLADELVGIGVGLGEDFGVFDVVEGGGRQVAVDVLQAQSLDAALANVDAPDAGGRCRHERDLLNGLPMWTRARAYLLKLDDLGRVVNGSLSHETRMWAIR